MIGTLGDIIWIGLGMALNPVAIVLSVLIANRDDPRRNGAAYVLGWLFGLGLLVVLPAFVLHDRFGLQDGMRGALLVRFSLFRAALLKGVTAREVVQLYALSGHDGAARVTVEGEGGRPVLARRDEVKEVLVNLLENARQAGAGKVVVRVEARGRSVSVVDEGEGIPPDVLARVFEPRFSTTSSGAGLGLAITRRLVEGWGAKITLESEVGQGTCATVAFP